MACSIASKLSYALEEFIGPGSAELDRPSRTKACCGDLVPDNCLRDLERSHVRPTERTSSPSISIPNLICLGVNTHRHRDIARRDDDGSCDDRCDCSRRYGGVRYAAVCECAPYYNRQQNGDTPDFDDTLESVPPQRSELKAPPRSQLNLPFSQEPPAFSPPTIAEFRAASRTIADRLGA